MQLTTYTSICRNIPGELRDYQQKAKSEIFSAWDTCDNVMFQMPTGTGKTRLFSSIINDINRWGVQNGEHIKILIIAHRTELIQQIDESLDYFHVPHGIIAGAFKGKRDTKKPVQVASIQTITNKYNRELAENLKFQFVIIDEAHHSMADTYQKLWDLYKGSKKLGVTATPWRMSGSGFTDIYDKLILSMSVKEFIRKGWLSSYKYFSLKGSSPIRRAINSIHEFDPEGDYKISALENAMDKDHIRAQLLSSYKNLAWGKKGIIYAISIAHAQHICEMYKAAGLNVVAIDSHTPNDERKQLVTDFKAGKIDIIVNVDIFSEGFDCPDIEFIQLARPTKSLVKYIQQVGRGLRRNGDTECLILDNVGMHSRFGLPDSRRHWNMHFLGNGGEEDVKYEATGTGESRYREVNMTEGNEEMVMIQNVEAGEQPEDADYKPDNEKEAIIAEKASHIFKNNSVLPKDIKQFDPMPILKKVGYEPNGDIFWNDNIRQIYDAYIYEDGDFVIENVVIVGEGYHRILVAKVKPHTNLFYKLEQGKAEDISLINHLCGHQTIIGVCYADKGRETKKYDFEGAQYNPEFTYENILDIETTAMYNEYEPSVVDMPVSKIEYQYYRDGEKYIIGRMLNNSVLPVACISAKSELGCLIYSSQDFKITYNDSESIHVVLIEDGKRKVIYYNIYGVKTTGRKISEVEAIVKRMTAPMEKVEEKKPDFMDMLSAESKKFIEEEHENYLLRKELEKSLAEKAKIEAASEPSIIPVRRSVRTVDLRGKICYSTAKKKSYLIPTSFSKKIFDDKCQIVSHKEGYFLFIIGGVYYHLAELNPDGISGGSIWIKKTTSDKRLKIIHSYNGKEYVVGFVTKGNKVITFVNAQDKSVGDKIIHTDF